MTSRLKRKLGDLGVDTTSRKANENFCLVGLLIHLIMRKNHVNQDLDWHPFTPSGEIERYWGVCSTLETRGPDSRFFEKCIVSNLFKTAGTR